jgi:hypothetical protein
MPEIANQVRRREMETDIYLKILREFRTYPPGTSAQSQDRNLATIHKQPITCSGIGERIAKVLFEHESALSGAQVVNRRVQSECK